MSAETEPALIYLINNRQLIKMQHGVQQGQTWNKRQKHDEASLHMPDSICRKNSEEQWE